MRKNIQEFFTRYNAKLIEKDHLTFVCVKDINEGAKLLKKLIYFLVDNQTALFLSGGKTPENIYRVLANERKLEAAEVAMVDERFGDPGHENSNEEMIRDTGLLSYFEENKIPFHSILRVGFKGVVSELAKEYGKDIGRLISSFPKRIAIMGVGEDGHTAGLPASPKLPPRLGEAGQRGEPPGIKNSKLKIQNYVTEIRDFPGEFKKRITLTFNALSKMDILIVLVFGSAKKKALDLMFTKGSEEEIPARFYAKHGITEKTILITDQKV